MDETMVGWIFLLAMLILRGLQTLNCMQRCLHFFGRATPFLQWYTLTVAGLSILLIRSLADIIMYDYVAFDFLNPEKIEQKLDSICAGTDLDASACQKLKDSLLIPNWLHMLSLFAPVCGLLAFVLLLVLLFRFVKYNHQKKLEDESPSPWKLAVRLEWVIVILGMPLIFIVMAMRSLIRIWAVMTGSFWKPGVDFESMNRLELSTYQMDLELAVTVQFLAIWMFGMLCSSFLQHSKYIRSATESDNEERAATQQYRRMLAYTSIQGVYAFVVIGLLRAIFDISVTYLEENPKYQSTAEEIENTFITKVGTIFTFVTLLCMINMILISKLRDIKDNLGNANLKFLGTRLLLLIAQIQPQILSAITVGHPLHENLRPVSVKYHFEEYYDRWTFTDYQAKLAHASVLNVECLVVVLVTCFFWQLDDGQREALMKDVSGVADARESKAGDGYKLLDA
ncbi:unnamed protein product [Polarella glacialis]|uniref:Uncharacterized protein n=1 Tax=Polarella glacialis TaxID=89957 RepID=A0A813DJM8_POLGL|nr:unnamed protein product [Polarella glacialis]|mmetsp:Transcript_70098/g.126324  ORF Transcript_70098/g.126324 Transcript_70098/m.126324 type:complete len:454 (+) Transcript_70098:77-1438(+)|eukprot:CAMPEP_0115083138 /NCGR_PEP_ID=MMETSP0227-20121206/20348_1 /TAXON_ID=89957 /ORGANISM="Polarella glacialis, Strain CCMP 1383" /LENGTH=453 /DNA_ID=CAMNT_0002471421 /DNA_START=77 /DNA_END=1438 /DNA_ORIENTATION=+